MSSRISRFVFLMTLTLCGQAYAQAVQVNATSAVSGQIKIGEQPARNVSVTLSRTDQRGGVTGGIKASTDENGRYQITGLAAGRYRLSAFAPGFIISRDDNTISGGYQITLAEAQTMQGVNFTLARGGVITGKITTNGGRPVIGEAVSITPVDASGAVTGANNGQTPGIPPPPPFEMNNTRTDDRGVYRAYGLTAGRYVVSAGSAGGNNQGGPGRFGGIGSARTYQRTYHPEATEVTEATVVELASGREITGVDIRMITRETYAAMGRVIDAETNRPVAGLLVGHSGAPREGSRRQATVGNTPDTMTGPEGEFSVEGLLPGRYAFAMVQDPNTASSEYYSEPVAAEVVSADVTGLELRLKRAASVSGTVIFDGGVDPGVMAGLRVMAAVRGQGGGGGGNPPASVAPNGSFRIGGLTPGRLNLNVMDINAPGNSGLTLMRMERNGTEMPGGLNVQEGEQVAGLRLLMMYGNGVIRGMVRVEGAEAMPGLRFMVMARRVDSANGGGRGGGGGGGFAGGAQPAQVDAQGRFQIERLVPGTYELYAMPMGGFGGGFGRGPQGQPGQPQPGQQPGQPQGQPGQPQGPQGPPLGPGGNATQALQTVVVGKGAAVDVTLTVNAATMSIPQGGNQGGRPGGPGNGQNGQGIPPGNGQGGNRNGRGRP
ncbi:MAG: carboxypeptidase regulatory-like domain-containing protein [Blastocatellia bacterium]